MIRSNFNLLSSVSSVGWSLIRISCGLRYDNNGTWRFTGTSDAFASLDFKGTSVWIYGAKRNNHGEYIAGIDSQGQLFDGFDAGGLFQQVLFSAFELNSSAHSVSVLDVGNDPLSYLDVDSVSILIL